VLVIELGSSLDADEFRKAGLRVLDSSDKAFVVAFADDPQLAGFLERLDACAGGVPPGQHAEPYAGFVDAIDQVRRLEPADRMSQNLYDAVAQAAPDDTLRIDVELWHPDDRDMALAWVDELRHAVSEGGGSVADAYVNDRAGVVLARIYVPAGRVETIAQLDTVASLDLLPTPALTLPQFWRASPDDLPAVASPAANTPLVGLVDSGVASGHPLIGASVAAAEALSGAIEDGEDRCGHGTMVAGLILHGPVDRAVAQGLVARPSLCSTPTTIFPTASCGSGTFWKRWSGVPPRERPSSTCRSAIVDDRFVPRASCPLLRYSTRPPAVSA
jgi:hypothetical protein